MPTLNQNGLSKKIKRSVRYSTKMLYPKFLYLNKVFNTALDGPPRDTVSTIVITKLVIALGLPKFRKNIIIGN